MEMYVEDIATDEVKSVVKETVTVTDEKAAVTEETVNAIIEKTEDGKAVILPLAEVAEEDQSVKEADIPVSAIEAIVEAESALTVEFEGVKVTFESETIKAIAEQAQGSTIELRVVPVEHHELNEEQQLVLAAHDVAVRVSAQIFSDGEYIGDFKGGKARIAIPFTPVEGRNPEDNYDGDKVEEIEIDSMKGSVIKLKEQDSSIKKYAIYVQSEKMNFSVRITVEGNNQIEEREIVELARGIIQTRYLPFKEGEKI